MDSVRNGGGLLSSSTIKILACIFMAIDHIGLCFFTDMIVFRAIGRLALPLFAFFIAEGCRYTRNKLKRFLMLFGMGILYFAFYYVYSGVVYANVFLTFSVSVLLIYLLQFCKREVFKKPSAIRIIGAIVIFAAAITVAYFLFELIAFDYGFDGMLLPVFASLFDFKDTGAPEFLARLDNKYVKLAAFSVGLLILSIDAVFGYWQLFCFLSLIPLLLYNGRVGNKKLKYVFYVFYPVHLIIIEGLAIIIRMI